MYIGPQSHLRVHPWGDSPALHVKTGGPRSIPRLSPQAHLRSSQNCPIKCHTLENLSSRGTQGSRTQLGRPPQRGPGAGLHPLPGREVPRGWEKAPYFWLDCTLLWRPQPNRLGQAPASCFPESRFHQGWGTGSHGHHPANISDAWMERCPPGMWGGIQTRVPFHSPVSIEATECL